MKILVCGDRNWDDFDLIWRVLQECHRKYGSEITIIEGGANGADKLAAKACESFNFEVIEVPAEWHIYGRGAGPIRNQKMLEMGPDLVIGFHQRIWSSKGTANMLKIAKAADIPTRLITGTKKEEWLLEQ